MLENPRPLGSSRKTVWARVNSVNRQRKVPARWQLSHRSVFSGSPFLWQWCGTALCQRDSRVGDEGRQRSLLARPVKDFSPQTYGSASRLWLPVIQPSSYSPGACHLLLCQLLSTVSLPISWISLSPGPTSHEPQSGKLKGKEVPFYGHRASKKLS